MAKDVTITLSVNAKDLYELTPSRSKSDVYSKCSLKDNNNGQIEDPVVDDTKKEGIECFTSGVYENHTVTWIVVQEPQNNNYSVDIESIDINGMPDFENGNLWTDENVATFYYNIRFNVTEIGGNTENFEIDPKIKGNPKT